MRQNNNVASRNAHKIETSVTNIQKNYIIATQIKKTMAVSIES